MILHSTQAESQKALILQGERCCPLVLPVGGVGDGQAGQGILAIGSGLLGRGRAPTLRDDVRRRRVIFPG